MELQELLALEPGSAERFESLWLGYTDSLGNPELRQAIAATYEGVNHNQILVHTGAEEAIFNFMNVALNPGDHIIVQAPYYQSLGEVARSIGAEVSPWEGNPAKGWELDIDMLKTLLRADTRVVVVNFPTTLPGFCPRLHLCASWPNSPISMGSLSFRMKSTVGWSLILPTAYRLLSSSATRRYRLV